VCELRTFILKLYLLFFSKDGDDKKRPVIIHRAILGSVERMIAILAENYGGKWYVAQMQFQEMFNDVENTDPP